MTLICETIHEHMKILPKYILKMPLRANTNTNKHNGTQPNKKIKKKKKKYTSFDKKMKFNQPLSKITPTLEILESKA